jgi:hypothetical protein
MATTPDATERLLDRVEKILSKVFSIIAALWVGFETANAQHEKRVAATVAKRVQAENEVANMTTDQQMDFILRDKSKTKKIILILLSVPMLSAASCATDSFCQAYAPLPIGELAANGNATKFKGDYPRTTEWIATNECTYALKCLGEQSCQTDQKDGQ